MKTPTTGLRFAVAAALCAASLLAVSSPVLADTLT